MARLALHHMPAQRQRGLSLIELMISITLGLLILSTLSAMFVRQNQARNELDKSNRLVENGRYAMELLTNNLRLAGFYGELDPSTLAIPNPTATTPPDPCTTPSSTVLPLHVQGYNNLTSASNGASVNTSSVSAKPSCLPSVIDGTTVLGGIVSGTDILVMRRTETSTKAVAGLTAAAPYVQVSLCQYDSDPVVVGTSGFTLRQKDCTNSGTGTIAPVRRFLEEMYFVSSCNVYASGQTTCTPNADNGRPIPTLKRYELASDGTWRIVSLVEGVQNMKLEYGLDTNNDGIPDTYTACTGTTCTNTQWSNVVAVRIYLLVRNNDSTNGYTDAKTYTLGSTVVGPFNDAYKRHVYSQFVRLVNPAGRREIP